ncbi:MAG: hypothetical protein DRP50_02670 [Thermotoga sp.]|nr:MAG: hypothetical protein DRP50_02670 [Thermotoga sp.]
MRKLIVFSICTILFVFGLNTILQAKTITITLWENEWEVKNNARAEQIKAFEKAYPDIHVVYQHWPWATWWQKLTASLAAGTGPDLLGMGAWSDKYGHGIIPIPESFLKEIDWEDWILPARLGATLKGKVYYIPYSTSDFMLFYNTDLFEKAGLDPNKPPTTWAELYDYAKKLTVYKNNRLVQSGFGVHCDQIPWIWQEFYVELGGHLISTDGKTAMFNNAAGIRSLNYILSFLKDGINSMEFPEAYQGFVKNVVGMVIAGTWFGGYLDYYYPSIHYGTCMLPIPEGAERVYMYDNSWGIGITKAAEKRGPEVLDACLKFLKFTNTKEGHLQMIGIDGPAVRYSLLKDPRTLEWLKGYSKMQPAFETVGYLREVGKRFEPSAYAREIESYFQDILYERITPEEGLKKLQTDLQKYLNEER